MGGKRDAAFRSPFDESRISGVWDSGVRIQLSGEGAPRWDPGRVEMCPEHGE